MGVSIISSATAFTYQYDKYIELDKLEKWMIFGFVAPHVIATGSMFYLLAKQQGAAGQINYWISKGVIPIAAAAIGIYHIVDMIDDCDNSSAYRILNSINALLKLADFFLIHESIKTQPEIYYPVHGIRVLTQAAESCTLFAEVIGTEEEPTTQAATA